MIVPPKDTLIVTYNRIGVISSKFRESVEASAWTGARHIVQEMNETRWVNNVVIR